MSLTQSGFKFFTDIDFLMFSNGDEGEAVFSVLHFLSLLPSQPFTHLLSWKGHKFSQMTLWDTVECPYPVWAVVLFSASFN